MIEINNSQEIIDSRDVINVLEEMEDERDALIDKLEEIATKEIDLINEFSETEDHDEKERIEGDLDVLNEEKESIQRELDEMEEEGGDYAIIKSFNDEGASFFGSDWSAGVTLVRDNYFTEYAEELCKGIGDFPKEIPWYIENHIDWDGVAEELKGDYAGIDFDGVTYWAR